MFNGSHTLRVKPYRRRHAAVQYQSRQRIAERKADREWHEQARVRGLEDLYSIRTYLIPEVAGRNMKAKDLFLVQKGRNKDWIEKALRYLNPEVREELTIKEFHEGALINLPRWLERRWAIVDVLEGNKYNMDGRMWAFPADRFGFDETQVNMDQMSTSDWFLIKAEPEPEPTANPSWWRKYFHR